MSRQNTYSESVRALVGGVLLGLGLHILSGTVDRTAGQLRASLGAAGDGLGTLPSAVVAFSQVGRAYAFDHQEFWLHLLRMLVSFWPLVLVIVGGMFLRDVVTEKVKTLPARTKYFRNKDMGCRFPCPSFDA